MKKLLYDLKSDLISKFNYDDSLAEAIAMACESIVDYYGEEYENTILNAISSCEVSILNNVKNVSAYKYRDGLFESVPTLNNGNVEIKKHITLPSTFNSLNPRYMGILVNKLFSLVRSELFNYKISGNSIICRKGLEKKTYNIKDMSEAKSLGSALESGIVSYSELCVMRSDYDDGYEPSSPNDYERCLAGYLMDNLYLKDIMDRAGITGDYSELEEVISSNMGMSLDEFLERVDGIRTLENERSKSVSNNERLGAMNSELDKYFSNIASMLQPLNNGLNPENNEYRKVA